MPSPTPAATPPEGFLDALPAAAPNLERLAAPDLFGWLAGSWDAVVADLLPGGGDRRQSAEMHFAWVLEGRAMQDLWIAPARGERGGEPEAGNRYGTTLRWWDAAAGVWRIAWLNPVTGIRSELVGRRAGNLVVQTGADASGRLLRWVFLPIGTEAFHWRGELSSDGGLSWQRDTEYLALRRGAASPAAALRSWSWNDRLGLESLSLGRDAGNRIARGRALVKLEGAPVAIGYRIAHDEHWRFLEAEIELVAGDRQHRIELRRLDGDETAGRRWTLDGEERPDLAGCEDIDLRASPYTNTPPLAARALAPGDTAALTVAWIDLPSLEVRAVRQEYTRLEDAGALARYRYRNLDSGFSGELTVDGEGLVVTYGPWSRR